MNNKKVQTPKSNKKLVQARLPFKLLTSTEKNELIPSATDKLGSKEPEIKVIKSDGSPNQQPNIISDEICILSDDDNEKNDISEEDSSMTQLNQNKTPDRKSEKVFIKLPIGSKKKKRKSSALNESMDRKVVDQTEAEDNTQTPESNPIKKIKISDVAVREKFENNTPRSLRSSSTSSIKSVIPIDDVEILDVSNVAIKEHNKDQSSLKPAKQNEKESSLGEVLETSTNIKETSILLDDDDDDQMNETNNSILDLTGDLPTSELETSLSKNRSKRKRVSLDKTNEESKNKLNVSKSKTDMQKDLQKLEREEQKRKEKEEKEKKRLQEKFEKEEKRRKEKEEKEQKRLAEIEAKNEEKRLREEEKKKKDELKEEERRKKEELKEEDRKKKEEEKRKKDELREEERKKKEEERKKKEIEKEEMENKKKKAAEVFTKFFVQSRHTKGNDEESISEKVDEIFMPFQIKDDMKLAPIARRLLNSESKKIVDDIVQNQKNAPASDLYMTSLKNGSHKPLKGNRTIPRAGNDDEIIIVDEMHGTTQFVDETTKSEKYKAKYFLFCENRRPPYFGTWRKKSSSIKPRKPFATDNNIFDYEVDSDLEWEEEEPGESLHGSDDEKESEDDYEVDNEFFVPHGHLSDEELEEEELEDQSPEFQKAKLKILQQEFASEMKKKTEKLKPRLLGVVWANKDYSKPESCPTVVWDFLRRQEMIYNTKVDIASLKSCSQENMSPSQQEKQKANKRIELPEECISSLIKLVHGNPNKRLFMIKEFQAYLENNESNPDKIHFTKSCIREKIDSMAQWKVTNNKNLQKKFLCWVVSDDVLQKYNLGDLDIQNKWKYIIPPKNRTENITEDETAIQKSNKLNESPTVITKFTKVLRKLEVEDSVQKMKSISKNKNDSSNVNQNTTSNIAKKRVPILFSVPRGQNVPETSKNIAVNEFLNKQSAPLLGSSSKTKESPNQVECIVLD